MTSAYGQHHAASRIADGSPRSATDDRDAAFEHVRSQLRAQVNQPSTAAKAGGWRLELPHDSAAAAEYLLGIERARAIELDAIRTLRRRIEAESGITPNRSLLTTRARRPLVIAAIVISTSAAAVAGWHAWTGQTAEPASPARAAATMDHSAHSGGGGMGSGLAVDLGEFFVKPMRSTTAPGETTFVLRNTGSADHEFMVIPVSKVRGSVAAMSGDELHQIAVAAVHDLKPGTRKEVSVELAAGQYLLLCNLPGHRASGQSTKLTVA